MGLLPAPIKDSDDRDDPRDRLPAALDEKIAVLRFGLSYLVTSDAALPVLAEVISGL